MEGTCGIVIRPSCQNNCLFCRKWPKVGQKELKRQEEAFLKNILEHKEKGYKRIEISGNDPIEYPNIVNLIKLLRGKMRFSFVQISTHGVDLGDEEFAARFCEAKPGLVRIPLYGSRAKIHDAVTQNPGSFDKTVKGIRFLKKKGIEVMLSSLFLKQNQNDLVDIYKLMLELSPAGIYFSIPCLINEFRNYYIPYKEQGPIVRKLHEFAKRKQTHISFEEIPYCVLGYYSEVIHNKLGPPDLGSFNQPEGSNRTNKKDWPAYRIKVHLEMCNKCKYRNVCDGFFKRDVEIFGLGKIKPLEN